MESHPRAAHMEDFGMTTQLDTTQLPAKHTYENPIVEFDFEGELTSISGTPVTHE